MARTTTTRRNQVANANVTNPSTPEYISVKEYCKRKGFVQTAQAIRANTNNYLYITFIDKNNEAENVYFSKAAAAEFAEGEVIDMALLKELTVGIAIPNADGEPRDKLCMIGESTRLELDFDDEE